MKGKVDVRGIKLSTKCYLYAICKYISFLLMFFWCQSVFFGAYTDYFIQGFNIIISVVFYASLKNNRLHKAASCQKNNIVLEVVLILIFFTMTDLAVELIWIIRIIYICILIVEIKVFCEILNKASKVSKILIFEDCCIEMQARKKIWKIINWLILANIFLIIILRNMAAFWFLFILMSVRFYYQLIITKACCEIFSYQGPAKNIVETCEPISRKTIIIRRIINSSVVCLVVIVLLLRFIYAGQSYESEEDDTIVQYHIANLMPYWTGFHKDKFGLRDTATGEDTGAIYDRYLFFDGENIAWDYNGHFVDKHGNIVIDTPPSVKAYYSRREEIFYITYVNFVEGIPGTYAWLDRFEEEAIDTPGFGYPYFTSGVIKFYSGLYDDYGLLDKHGNIILAPEYIHISTYPEEQTFEVVNHSREIIIVQVSDGKIISMKEKGEND